MKTSTGIRTIAPRRRGSNVSSDSSSYSNKVANYSQYSDASAANQIITSPIRQTSILTNGARKRLNASIGSNGNTNNQIAAKRSKISKRIRSQNGSPNVSRSNSMLTPNTKRQPSDNEEMESIERRNLHNDMERQRRIGLKNLFENLKDKIPSLREKDRAPKVNILREATMLCNKLTRDDMEYEALKRRQQRLVQRLKQLRASMPGSRATFV